MIAKKNKRKRKVKDDEQPKEKKPCVSYHGIISPSALVTLMGEERWNAILDYIEAHHDTRKVVLGCHSQGGGAEVYIGEQTRQYLGNIAKVERKSNRWRKDNGLKAIKLTKTIDDGHKKPIEREERQKENVGKKTKTENAKPTSRRRGKGSETGTHDDWFADIRNKGRNKKDR